MTLARSSLHRPMIRRKLRSPVAAVLGLLALPVILGGCGVSGSTLAIGTVTWQVAAGAVSLGSAAINPRREGPPPPRFERPNAGSAGSSSSLFFLPDDSPAPIPEPHADDPGLGTATGL